MTHPDVEITADLVRDLVRDQHPDLAGGSVRLGARGWSNQLWRLGDDLAVRLPWALGSVVDDQIRSEYAWLPGMAPRLPMPIPLPRRLGEPSEVFPRPWLITTWVAGTPADVRPVERGVESLAAFLTALHQPAPSGAPEGQGRGGPLADRAEGFAGGLATVTERGLVADPGAIAEVWADALAAPPWTGPPMWLHADLHPANVLTDGGDLCGVVDFGDMCAGDPAYDLSAVWLLLPDGSADRFFAAYRPAVDEATIRRARGWAMARVLSGILIGDAGVHGRPGGKRTWGPPAQAALRRLTQARS